MLDSFDDYGKAIDPYHGLEVGSHVSMHYAIHPDDPASAVFASDWQFTFARDDWQVTIETENKMTCDAENFHLLRRVTAREGAEGAEVLVKEWQETIPRGFL